MIVAKCLKQQQPFKPIQELAHDINVSATFNVSIRFSDNSIHPDWGGGIR